MTTTELYRYSSSYHFSRQTYAVRDIRLSCLYHLQLGVDWKQSSGSTLEIDWVYIGTRRIPLKTRRPRRRPVDQLRRTACGWAFGKGLAVSGQSYLQAPGPMIGTTGTVGYISQPSSFGTYNRLYIQRASGLKGSSRDVINRDS